MSFNVSEKKLKKMFTHANQIMEFIALNSLITSFFLTGPVIIIINYRINLLASFLKIHISMNS